MINLTKVLPRILRHRGPPLSLIYFITSKCNLRCRHCFYAENLNMPEDELSIDEIERISRGMGYLLWFSITGGEPFLRSDVARVAEIFYRNNKCDFLNINTNGYFKDSIIQPVSEICKTCERSRIKVYVSLDGLEETHNRIRQTRDGFKRAIETIRELMRLKKAFKNLNVATITTCNRENQGEIKALALFIKKDIGPDSMMVNMLRGKPRSTPLGDIDLKAYLEFIKVQQEGFSRGLAMKRELLQERMIAAIFNEDRYVIPCLSGNISGVMTETGDVYPCELLGKKFGNIRDANYDFTGLWNSKRAGEIRKFIKDTRCYCTYECAMATNILFNMTQLIRIPFL
ncbi:MAG: radical SAM protein [Candidatus Omnitrophica bacterium]|nr:radical SAM protein [Candidatus Omnitrophota bacterium]